MSPLCSTTVASAGFDCILNMKIKIANDTYEGTRGGGTINKNGLKKITCQIMEVKLWTITSGEGTSWGRGGGN